jgi:hypothetical protein
MNVIPVTSAAVESRPVIFDSLPDLPISSSGCPRRTKLEIDLMLLGIESLELESAELMLSMAEELDLKKIIKNRLVLWRLRCTNPLRKAHTRRILTLEEAKALVIISSQLARRLTVTIRQLLLAYQQLSDKELPPEYNFRLSEYLDRFRAHFRSRMNPKRTLVAFYQDDDQLNQLAIEVLGKLLFCTGTSGIQRFWISLFDAEVE